MAGTPWPFWSSLQPEPSPSSGRNRKQSDALGHCRPAQLGGSRCTGMASCCHCSCRRARVSSSNGWLGLLEVSLLGDVHCPSVGHFAICLTIIVCGPESVMDLVLVAPGVQGRMSSKLDQEVLISQGEELSQASLLPCPYVPQH